jgi:NitT/TauT family transport system substrate-binding protein
VSINVSPTSSFAPFAIGKEQGEFAAEGIDLILEPIDINSSLLALMEGKLDAVSAPVRTGMFNMIETGRVQIVADKGHSSARCADEAFVATPALVKRLKNASGKLKGFPFATSRGGGMEYLTDKLLASQKLTTADVEFVQLPQTDLMSSRRLEVEAIRFMGDPHLSEMLAKKAVEMISTTESVAPGHQSSVILYGPHLLKQDRNLGERFMRAYLRSVRRYAEGATPANVAMVSKLTTIPPDVIQRTCWTEFSSDGHVNVASVQDFLEWAHAHKYIERIPAVSEWWNPAFVDAASKSLGPAKAH